MKKPITTLIYFLTIWGSSLMPWVILANAILSIASILGASYATIVAHRPDDLEKNNFFSINELVFVLVTLLWCGACQFMRY